jgi:hypothetical protein
MTADYSAVDQQGAVHVAELLARAEREHWPTSSLAAHNHALRQADDAPTIPLPAVTEHDPR